MPTNHTRGTRQRKENDLHTYKRYGLLFLNRQSVVLSINHRGIIGTVSAPSAGEPSIDGDDER